MLVGATQSAILNEWKVAILAARLTGSAALLTGGLLVESWHG
jgi:hypothetical protein